MSGKAQRTAFYATWFLPAGTPLECCRRVKEAGFDGASFQVGTLDDPRRLDLLSERDAEELRAGLVEMGLDRSLHVSTPDYIDHAKDLSAALVTLKQHVRAGIEALSGPGLPSLNVSIDPPLRFSRGDPWQPWDTAEELVAFLAALTDSYSVRPGLENWPYLPVGTPEALGAQLLAGRGKVGVLLDAGHAHIALSRGWCEQRDMAGFVRALPAPIVEVHFHDNNGSSDEHLMPGEGTADLHGLLAAVSARGFSGPFTVECNLSKRGFSSLGAALAHIRTKYGL